MFFKHPSLKMGPLVIPVVRKDQQIPTSYTLLQTHKCHFTKYAVIHITHAIVYVQLDTAIIQYGNGLISRLSTYLALQQL